MSEWKDIETAPKDGTEIDVWCYCHDPDWRSQLGLSSGERLTGVSWRDGEWKVFDGSRGEMMRVTSGHYTVSHWMPPPAPPDR